MRLPPLYDIASMLPYEHDPLKLHLAMKVGGEHRFNAVSAQHWHELALHLSMDPDELLSRARTLAVQLPDAHSEACVEATAVRPSTTRPPRTVDAVSAWAQRCLTSLERFRARPSVRQTAASSPPPGSEPLPQQPRS